MNRLALITWLGLALLIACGSDPRPAAEPAPPAPAVPAPAVQQAPIAEVEPSAAELPLPDDFAAEAEQEVTSENLHAQLDNLEKEIQADSP